MDKYVQIVKNKKHQINKHRCTEARLSVCSGKLKQASHSQGKNCSRKASGYDALTVHLKHILLSSISDVLEKN